MFYNRTITYLFFLTGCFTGIAAQAQTNTNDKIVRAFDQYRNRALQEKLYVHTDRTVYVTGDYLWLKVYCVDGTMHQPLDMSKVAYVEIVDEHNTSMVQAKVSLDKGVGHTALFIPSTLNSGNYTFRAYTRWMMNYPPELYFSKTITVINPFKTLEPAEHAREQQYDIQFFPEGGELVAGLKSKVAFRMVDSQGLGIAREGFIVNQSNDTLATFEPLKFGLGHFYLTPAANTTYKALIRDLSGGYITRMLPPVREQGYVMALKEEADQVLVTVTSSVQTGQVQLLAHTRNVIAPTVTQSLQNGSTTFSLKKDLLQEGISHITIFDANQAPVCERLFFKPVRRSLLLTQETNKKRYNTRNRVAIAITANDAVNAPQAADLSVSVYRLDSLQQPDAMDIQNYFMFTSELAGTVESPAYYFSNDADVAQATDNLMLTHGWRRFKWNEVLTGTDAYPYFPEYRGPIVTGKLVNKETGEPARGGIPVYLSVPGKQFHLRGSRSNLQGNVKFELTNFYGPNKIIVQTNTATIDSIYSIVINDPFSTQYSVARPSRLNLSKAYAGQVLTRSINMQLANAYYENLRSVKILPKADTIPFYGTPDARYYLDDYTRFTTMEDVMREYVPGVFVRKRKNNFYFLTLNKNSNEVFHDDPLVLLDGVPVFSINKIMEYSPLKVKRLDVMTRRYFYGALTFNGIVSYTTYHNNMPDFRIDERALVKDYEGVQWQREFFSPVYETAVQRQSRVADFRDLLFWSPAVKTDAQGKASVTFYTSDQPGRYLINVQGMTPDGKNGSNSVTINVAPQENN